MPASKAKGPIPVMEVECPKCGSIEIEDRSPGTITRRLIGHCDGEPVFVFERFEVESTECRYRCVDCGKHSKQLKIFVRPEDPEYPF